MDRKNAQKLLLLGLPCLLIPSTALVFVWAATWWGQEGGYVVGFSFYWVVWCGLVPLSILKKEGLAALFREEKPLFRKSNWGPAALLVLIVALTISMYPPTGLLSVSRKLLLIALPVAILNGICEEILWRGVYVQVFRQHWVLGVLYPAIGFAFWHISPQLIFPAETGMGPFVWSTFFLGLSYGWISYRTGSIKWNALAHSFGGILALGGALAPSLVVLLFP